MDAKDLVHYLADQPPTVVRLEIEKHFEALTDKQKRYAHFISKYAAAPFPASSQSINRRLSAPVLRLVPSLLTHNPSPIVELRLQARELSCASSLPSLSLSMI